MWRNKGSAKSGFGALFSQNKAKQAREVKGGLLRAPYWQANYKLQTVAEKYFIQVTFAQYGALKKNYH